jgi:hypothetical protein
VSCAQGTQGMEVLQSEGLCFRMAQHAPWYRLRIFSCLRLQMPPLDLTDRIEVEAGKL